MAGGPTATPSLPLPPAPTGQFTAVPRLPWSSIPGLTLLRVVREDEAGTRAVSARRTEGDGCVRQGQRGVQP
jgi:hypothetical protein